MNCLHKVLKNAKFSTDCKHKNMDFHTMLHLNMFIIVSAYLLMPLIKFHTHMGILNKNNASKIQP